MGWESRRNGLYYYRKVRHGHGLCRNTSGQVPSRRMAECQPILAAIEADEERSQKAELDELWSQIRAHPDRVELAVRRLFVSMEIEFASTMIAAGCH